MTKKEITPLQAMQYLTMLVALDNSQVAKDTLEYFENLQQENEDLNQASILSILDKMLDENKTEANVTLNFGEEKIKLHLSVTGCEKKQSE